jgi:hypothetical protein
VVAAGSQLIVHHEYTVSLPTTFGEFIYKMGGRVEHEDEHAHHAIVVIASYWWGWSGAERDRLALELPRLLETLGSDDGALSKVDLASWPSAWRVGREFGEGDLTVGAVFRDPVEGATALRAAADRHGAYMKLRVHEAASDDHDPLVHLRPSTPPPAVPRFDVWVRDAGAQPKALHDAVCDELGYGSRPEKLLETLPGPIAHSLSESIAQSVAAALRKAGAVVELVRNDG